MSFIDVQNLTRDFIYYEKEIGLKGSVKNLFKRKEKIKHAVKNISFSIEQGECVGFIGPNGAGKTTTLKMLSGILHPSSGIATVNGYIPWERKNAFKKCFSFVAGQKQQLWPDLPAIDSMYLNKNLYEIDDKAYAQTLDELTSLFDVKSMLNIQVRRLSLGERMKMEFISSLLHRPQIVFLDEPTIGLDIAAQVTIRKFLKEYCAVNKTTIILTSHYMSDIEELCKRSIIINNGEKAYDGDLELIRSNYGEKKYLSIVLGDLNAQNDIEKYGKVIKRNENKVTLELSKKDFKEKINEILDDFSVVDFTVEEAPIEECISLIYSRGLTHEKED